MRATTRLRDNGTTGPRRPRVALVLWSVVCGLVVASCASRTDRIEIKSSTWSPARVQPEPEPVFTHDPLNPPLPPAPPKSPLRSVPPGAAAIAAPTNGPSVVLAWDEPATRTNLLGYRVYWGGRSGTYTNSASVLVPTNTATITGLVSGATYYLTAKSWNASAESGPSNEVSYTLPAGSDVLTIRVTLLSRTRLDVSSWTVEQTPPLSFIVTNADPKKFFGSRLDISIKQ